MSVSVGVNKQMPIKMNSEYFFSNSNSFEKRKQNAKYKNNSAAISKYAMKLQIFVLSKLNNSSSMPEWNANDFIKPVAVPHKMNETIPKMIYESISGFHCFFIVNTMYVSTRITILS